MFFSKILTFLNNNNKHDVTAASDVDVEDNGFVILPSNELEQMEEDDFVLFPIETPLVVLEQPNCCCSKIEQMETLWNMSLKAKNDLVYAIIDIYHDSITKENLAYQLQQGFYKLQNFWEQDIKGVWRCALWIRNEIAALS